VPLFVFQKNNGRYCIDFSQFHDTNAMDMPRCSAKEWQDRRQEDTSDEGFTSNNEPDSPVSFKCGMTRSSSFPSQPTLRVGLSLVGKMKRSRDVGVPPSAESGESRARSSSCTERLLPSSLSSPMSRQPLKPHASSVVALYQSLRSDSEDSGISNTSMKLLSEGSSDRRVLFQLEDIVEDGFMSAGLNSPNNFSIV